jgi:hypothetical protein
LMTSPANWPIMDIHGGRSRTYSRRPQGTFEGSPGRIHHKLPLKAHPRLTIVSRDLKSPPGGGGGPGVRLCETS